MFSLIQTDPEHAIAWAIPARTKASLPAEVQALLEEQVSGRGDYEVFCVLPLPGPEAEGPVIRRQVTLAGKTYRAFVYGARAEHPTHKDLPLHGVALDDVMALDEHAVRRLAAEELSLRGEDIASGAPCPVCDQPANVRGTPVAGEVGGQITWFCCEEHLAQYDRQLLAAAGELGGGDPAGNLAASPYTEGRKRVIIFRVDFPDAPGPAMSVEQGLTLITNINDWFVKYSYGHMSVAMPGQGSVVTEPLRLPNDSTYYDGEAGRLRNDARAAARAAGYDLSQFDFDMTTVGSKPKFSWAGLGYIGAPGLWLANGYFGTSTTVHELGHNLGLGHANYWDTSGESVIGPGQNDEYGDKFDVMGSGGTRGPYNPWSKQYLDWMPGADCPRINTSGRYRIYAHDHPDARGLRGLRIFKDSEHDYLLQFSQLYTDNRWLMNGLGLRWGKATSCQLLDTTPGTSHGRDDSAIVIGRTYSDPDLDVHITPIGKGNTYPESIDVVVNFGPFPGNQPPEIAIEPRSVSTAPGATVTLTASAADPNNDTLAYYWDFGDDTFGDNNPEATHSWSSTGEYVVRCTVSDMKGGTASDSIVVRVGSPSTFKISGRVFDHGQPLEGVFVKADNDHYAYTDSDGAYTITGLRAGSYQVTATLFGYNFTGAWFTNPVRVGPDATGIDFIAVESSVSDIELVSMGAVWKYLDDGSNQGTAWRDPNFDDSNWPSGPAQLGYGDGDEATVVSYGPDANDKYITTYFRHAFNVTDPTSLTNLTVELLRDDGAVVYLNGVEVVRDNMPDGLIGYDTRASSTSEATITRQIDSTLLVAGRNVLAVEIHQANPTSSDISFDLALRATSVTNLLGLSLAYIAEPEDHAVIETGADVTISVNAFSSGAAFTRAEFYVDNVKIGEDTTAPFSTIWPAVEAGNHTILVRIWDASGQRSILPAVRVAVREPEGEQKLIAAGSVWRYLDDGSDQGVAWRAREFDDSAWATGRAELGYGDGDETTVVSYGPSASAKFITTYFRRAFNVLDPARFSGLRLRVLRDDGVIVYLNGVEVFRDNLPSGAVTYLTPATQALEDDDTFLEASLDPGLLVPGVNVIAAEIHQQSGTSSDISFDLELVGTLRPQREPGVEIVQPTAREIFTAPASVSVQADAVAPAGTMVSEVRFYAGSVWLATDPTAPYQTTWADPPPGTHTLRAVAALSNGQSLTSAPVIIAVQLPPAGLELIPRGAQWRYLVEGAAPPPQWNALDFDDRHWPQGRARLGYGDDGEVTRIGFGPDESKKYITTYFRHTFVVERPGEIQQLRLHLAYDDGAVVYLNGTEVYRANLLDGPISYNSLALTGRGGADEQTFEEAILEARYLRPGTNVLAVEVHQNSITSSDLGFDLGLIADRLTNLVQGVYLTSPPEGAQFTTPTTVTLTAYAQAQSGAVQQVGFYADGAMLGLSRTQPYAYAWNNPALGEHTLQAVAWLTSGLTLTSPPVRISVSAPPVPITEVLQTYIPSGSYWWYWDQATAPPADWATVDFDDSSWPRADARFGYGLDGERTTTTPRVTTYFRRRFPITNPALLDQLILQLQRDDGAVVYLNGQEVFRSNMPSGPVTHTTLASNTAEGADEQTFFMVTLPPSGLIRGWNVLAVEIHQAEVNDSDMGFDLQLNGSGSTAPRVLLTRPRSQETFAVGADIALEALPWPGSGRRVETLEFFANGQLLGVITNGPYTYTWSNVPAGAHTLTVRMTDQYGEVVTSPPVTVLVGYQPFADTLIPAGSIWRYLANGANLGTAWRQPDYDDSGWPAGRAQLGYGDGDEVTVVPSGPSANKYVTTYFRQAFVVPPQVTVTSLVVRLLRDDGAVVWLNGTELLRDNMPEGQAIDYLTLALSAVANSDEDRFYEFTVPAEALVPGTNVLAVEIHQNSRTSSDISFDLELEGFGFERQLPPPRLQLVRLPNGQVELSWPASAEGYELYVSDRLGPDARWVHISPAMLISNDVRYTVFRPVAGNRFFRLIKPEGQP